MGIEYSTDTITGAVPPPASTQVWVIILRTGKTNANKKFLKSLNYFKHKKIYINAMNSYLYFIHLIFGLIWFD